jgi:hypothetical protein
MSLLDKAKAAAQKVAEGAQKGAHQVQEKVEQSQTRKKADDLAKQLGYLIVRERSGGEAAGAAADDLVGQITALEAQLAAMQAGEDDAGTDAASATPMPATEPPPAASEPTAGDFKLD